MAGMEDILASLLRGQGPSPMAMGGGFDAAQDFGDSGPEESQTMMRPEDLIVSPNPSQPRSREQRMEGTRRLLTNFTFMLGSGLSAASQNPRGRGQRTMAGQGAILQVPEFLREKQEAAQRQAEADKLNIVKVIQQKRAQDTAEANQRSLAESRIDQGNDRDQTNRRLTDQGAELEALKRADLDRRTAADAAAVAEKNKPKKIDSYDGEDANGKPIRIEVMQNPDGSIHYVNGTAVHDKPRPTKLLTPEEEAQALRLAKAKGVARDQVVQVEGENGTTSFALLNKGTGEIRPTTAVGDATTTPKMTGDRLKLQTNARSGLSAVAKLREALKRPNALKELSVPGSPTERAARAARNEMVDVLTRIRTGAALNESEEAFYKGQAPGLADDLFSSPADIEYKLSIFEDNFKALAGVKKSAPTLGDSGITLDDIAKEKARRAAAKGK